MENKKSPYYKVAKNKLIEKEYGTEREIDLYIKKHNMEEIDKKVDVKKYVETAAKSIATRLGLNEKEREQFVKETLGNAEDTKMKNKIKSEIDNYFEDKYENFDEKLEYMIMSDLHYKKVEEYCSEKNRDKVKDDTLYKALPFELQGWKNVKKEYSGILGPMMRDIGVNYDEGDLKRYYNNKTMEYFRRHSIDSKEALIHHIHKLNWGPWSKKVKSEITDKSVIKEKILPNVEETTKTAKLLGAEKQKNNVSEEANEVKGEIKEEIEKIGDLPENMQEKVIKEVEGYLGEVRREENQHSTSDDDAR